MTVSGGRKLPPHGSVQRYRLELATPNLVPCERCKKANADKAARVRANAAARGARASMSIVDAPAGGDTVADTPVSTPGPIERAVIEDLAEIAEADHVRFHRSLSALALNLAQELDAETEITGRASVSGRLHDVLKSLGAREGGDGNGTLDVALGDFGDPLPGLSHLPA